MNEASSGKVNSLPTVFVIINGQSFLTRTKVNVAKLKFKIKYSVLVRIIKFQVTCAYNATLHNLPGKQLTTGSSGIPLKGLNKKIRISTTSINKEGEIPSFK